MKVFCKISLGLYTLFVLYLMFVWHRSPYSQNIVRLAPLASTILFIKKSILWKSIIINIVGNVVMFIPFGTVGFVYPKYRQLKPLVIDFISAITVVEALQYFTRLGVFDVDDIILNTIGVIIGFKLMTWYRLKSL
ncbi:VanZ family protein [Riemerella columbina]|uniref:VanZ family protein n=1 Tax=Riemerella columbina TaxID=103810 RepID=UPI000524D438|nr:VanZ family protein [Riemerella columbina]